MDMSEKWGELVACAGNELESQDTPQSTVGDKAAELKLSLERGLGRVLSAKVMVWGSSEGER